MAQSFFVFLQKQMNKRLQNSNVMLLLIVTLSLQFATSTGDVSNQDATLLNSQADVRDLAEDKRFSSFRSDLGKRSQEEPDLEELLDNDIDEDKRAAFRTDLGKRFGTSSFRSDLGKRYRFRSDLGEKRISGFRSDLGKRLSSFRSDLGKRYSGFRSDLGKRAMFRSDLGKRFGFRTDLGKRSDDDEKRFSAFRSDLGKRDYEDDEKRFAFRTDLGKRAGFRTDLGKRLFRTDLGKRSGGKYSPCSTITFWKMWSFIMQQSTQYEKKKAKTLFRLWNKKAYLVIHRIPEIFDAYIKQTNW